MKTNIRKNQCLDSLSDCLDVRKSAMLSCIIFEAHAGSLLSAVSIILSPTVLQEITNADAIRQSNLTNTHGQARGVV